MINFAALNLFLSEANALSSKPHLNKSEERRYTFLLSGIAALKAGATLESIDQEMLNADEKRNGLELTTLPTNKQKRAADFARWVKEYRAGSVGEGKNAIGAYAGLGFFVPADFVRDTTAAALKLGDEILNPDAVNFIDSTTGGPLVIPTHNDTSEDAAPVGEGAANEVDDVQFPGQVTLGGLSYRSTYVASLDALQDVEASRNLLDLWEDWTAERIARGVSKRMVNGLTTDPQVGIVNQLLNAGAVPQIAVGSSNNTGGAETGANSIGSADLANLVWNLDDMYADSPKCAFFMARKTLLKLALIVTKQGIPLVTWGTDGADARIFGYPVRICPSLGLPTASTVSVLFGDGNFIFVRRVLDALSGVRVLRERYILNGQIGLQTISRWHMQVGWQGNGQCPFTILQQHS